MYRWRQRKLQNNLSKCANVAMRCVFARKQYIYIYILVFQISDWCLLFWESDGSNYSNLLIVIKRTDERPQYWFVFLSIAMFGLGNVIVKRKCLAFFTGSSRNNLSHRFSSLSLSRFDLQHRKFLLIPLDGTKCSG